MNCSEEMIEAANERLRTLFAETAILLTHPDKNRQALAKERVFAVLFASGMDAVHDSPTAESGDAPKVSGSTIRDGE